MHVNWILALVALICWGSSVIWYFYSDLRRALQRLLRRQR